MITHDQRWSLPRGNTLVPSRWQATVPKPFPLEFRRDVVAVARRGQAPLPQVAKDFGISESCLHRWLKLADIEDGTRPGVIAVPSRHERMSAGASRSVGSAPPRGRRVGSPTTPIGVPCAQPGDPRTPFRALVRRAHCEGILPPNTRRVGRSGR
jgi:transposase-like protein